MHGRMTLLRFVFAAAALVSCASCTGGRTPLPVGKPTTKLHTFHAIAPLSTSFALARTPKLTWDIAPGMDGAVVTVCADRACTNVIQTHDVVGTSVVLDALPPGVYFWSLRTRATSDAGTAVTPLWQFSVGATRAVSGGARPGPLDTNGNGVADIAAGAAGALGGEGRVDVFVDGAFTAPALTLAGTTARGLGTSVASAVDVNGDGYGDLVVGARLGDAASAFVFYGSANGIDASAPTQLHAASDAVAGLGDVDGDGYGDVLVGSDLFLGGKNGIASESTKSLEHGVVPGASGDVDGDGLADAIVADIGEPHLVYFYRGDPDKPLDSVSWTLQGPVGSLFGSSLGTAGDINGDGFADILVGAPQMNNGGGNAFAYLGNAHGLANSPAIVLVYPDGGAGRFGGAVACAGDLDADGFDEIVIGAKSGGADGNGAAYLYTGGTTGVTNHAAQRLDAPMGATGFGSAVRDVGPGALAVGASSTGAVGSVFLFAHAPTTGTLATPTGTLTPSDFSVNTGFGTTIALRRRRGASKRGGAT
jgi:hypothetical protein